MPKLLSREEFRARCIERDGGKCLIPWCNNDVDEVHHNIERRLWDDEGYYMANGASVCNPHHRDAEKNHIPPQAFWYWIQDGPLTPPGLQSNINKWGEEFEVPPWTDHRDYIKYPSTGHLPFSPEWDGSRVDHQKVDQFLDIPLVVTIKMDGSNAMLTRDRVAARNGKHAEHVSFDMLKSIHAGMKHKIPSNLQVFGEWLYAKHSIHYKGDLAVDGYFQVFGVFDTNLNLWLSWDGVKKWAGWLGFRTTPVVTTTVFEEEWKFYDILQGLAGELVDEGHEGIVVRSRYPFHYGQFTKYMGKYVRKGHVDPDADHWSKGNVTRNEVVR